MKEYVTTPEDMKKDPKKITRWLAKFLAYAELLPPRQKRE